MYLGYCRSLNQFIERFMMAQSKIFSVVLLGVLLGGCHSVSFESHGNVESSSLTWSQETVDEQLVVKGIYPNLVNLRRIEEALVGGVDSAGLSKDQIYHLMGTPPLYTKGWHVREWGYLLHFYTPGYGTKGVTTCQYKILFDKDMIARSSHWNAVDPAGAKCPPNLKDYVLTENSLFNEDDQLAKTGANALFAFDRSSIDDINAKGKADLTKLAEQLKLFPSIHQITITGYTDTLGQAAYNLKLSQKRAETVKQYLVSLGLEAQVIRAVGRGEENPVKECRDIHEHKQLIACLQPNRRVEIKVDAPDFFPEKQVVR